jgi:hypothetical protein
MRALTMLTKILPSNIQYPTNSNNYTPNFANLDSENSSDPGMQLNLFKSNKQPNQWFAGALFAFSLLGSIHPNDMNHAKGRHHANFFYSHKIQKSNDDSGILRRGALPSAIC